jgi:transcriptional regulator with XRE-family HTH domain
LARIGLKIFYLRTRVRRISQQEMADVLGVRQATLSHIERGTTLPTYALLLELCRFFDVTPTFLMDDERGVIPATSDRWSMRGALLTAGMWIEAPRDRLIGLGDGRVLCPLLPGENFHDEDAKEARLREKAEVDRLAEERDALERLLVRTMQGELRRHPRRRRHERPEQAS